jgi:hypothetical protein
VRSVNSNSAALVKAARELQAHWAATAAAWRDSARVEFEAAYVDELLRGARSASGAMEQIEAVLRKAIAECS